MQLVLSNKALKLLKLCELTGFRSPHDLLEAAVDSLVCPAICMTEGCDYTTETRPNQTSGVCKACGGYTVASALVLSDAR